MNHPCQYSPEVIDILRAHIRAGERIHDPFAGTGHRLAALCERVGAVYTGTDIEDWPDHDRRVAVGDALNPDTYPAGPFTACTSPVYLNKRLADYPNGPLATTKTRGRRDYGISLGRPLHDGNLARYTGKPSRAPYYWAFHSQAVKHWGDRALVNIDLPIAQGWHDLLETHGYTTLTWVAAHTQRYGGLDNATVRADHEVVIIAEPRGHDVTEPPVGSWWFSRSVFSDEGANVGGAVVDVWPDGDTGELLVKLVGVHRGTVRYHILAESDCQPGASGGLARTDVLRDLLLALGRDQDRHHNPLLHLHGMTVLAGVLSRLEPAGRQR